MQDPESKAELLDDRITLLAPKGRQGGVTRARTLRAWPWLPIGVVGLLAVGLLALDSRPGGIAGRPSPSPSGPAAAVVPTPAVGEPIGPTLHTASAGEDVGPCGTGRVAVDPVIEPIAPERIAPFRHPAGGLLATAVELGPSSGSIVVSQTGEDGATVGRVVATFSGLDVQGPFGVTVVGWSAAGDQFLVRAAHEGRASGDSSCANLFMVYADGSGVRYLTDNGPGSSISAPAFAPRTGQVAFVQNDGLRVTDTDGADGTNKVADCPSPWSVQWSPDERHLVAACSGGQYLVIADTSGMRNVAIDADAVPVAAVWSPDSSSVTLVTAPGGNLKIGPLTVFDIDPSTALPIRRLVSDTSTEWVPSRFVSPNGEWLLIEGNLLGTQEFPSFVVDLTTGVTKRLPWPVFSGVVGQESFAWLPDGDSMLYGDNGTLYVLNLRERTRTEVGLVPVPDFAWVNREP